MEQSKIIDTLETYHPSSPSPDAAPTLAPLDPATTPPDSLPTACRHRPPPRQPLPRALRPTGEALASPLYPQKLLRSPILVGYQPHSHNEHDLALPPDDTSPMYL